MNKDSANQPSADDTAKDKTQEKDHVSDPSLNTDLGHDWTDEGGATPGGAATNVDPEKDSIL